MFYTEVISRLIRRCGRTVIFPAGTFSAYLNPLRERSNQLIPTESGIFHQGKWLLLADGDKAGVLSGGVIFSAGAEKFLLERIETVFLEDKPAYLWGIATKVPEEAGSNE